MRNVTVVAGGASVMNYRLRGIEDNSYVIGVNDAALYTRCHVAFTMDRLWLEGRQLLLKVIEPPEVWYRRGTPKNFEPPHRWNAFVHDEGYPTQMTKEYGKLNGSNSGTCAVNRAFQLKPERVFLLGFDMQRGPKSEKHWYPDYPWANDEKSGTKRGTFNDWAQEFADIALQFNREGIEVFNVNHRSLIEAFPVISFDEYLRMTK